MHSFAGASDSVKSSRLPDAGKGVRESVGLVLSGGGAKGIAHVGVIKALEDNEIPIDYVTGTSMGAIVGSLYCCGWTPEKMMELFTSNGFKSWSTGTIEKKLEYYFTMPAPTPEWLSLNLNFKDSTDIAGEIIPTSLINPIPMNMEFLKLYSPYTEQCKENFNNLFVPFRCVTSDVYHKHKIVCKDGSLGDAVRASMSFPLVFKPIELDGILVYDGGIYDNFPVNVMENEFDPDFIIGVSVSSPDRKPQPGNVYSQLEDMIIQNNDYSLPADKGVKIQVPVLNFGVLDFSSAREIYSIGYKTGLSMVDSIRKRLPSRVSPEEVDAGRRRFAASTPEVVFDSVAVTGALPNQARFLQYIFSDGHPERPIDMDQVQDAYYRVVGGGKMSDLLPQAEFGKDGRNTLLLKASVKKPWTVGLGGWVTSSTNSMLYLSFGYHTLSFNSLDVDLGGWIGQSYFATQLRAKFSLRSSLPSYMEVYGVLSRQKYYDTDQLFYRKPSPSFISDLQGFLRLNYCWAMGRMAKGYAGFSFGWEEEKYFPFNTGSFSDENKDASRYRIAAFKTGIELNTLNDRMYPSVGREWLLNVILSHERSRFMPGILSVEEGGWKSYPKGSAEMLWRHYFPLHDNFRLGTMANGMATIHKLHQNYMATLVHSPAFAPTPATRNYFNKAFRADNYVAFGVSPVWTPVGRSQIRGDFFGYLPVRNVRPDGNGMAEYSGWFHNPQFVGEVAAVYNFPFASLSVYVNYLSSPKANWNFGINFGLYFQAPKLLR